MSAPKRFGKAVARNRVRRWIRECLRLHPELPSAVDVVIGLYRPCDTFSFPMIRDVIHWAAPRLAVGAHHGGRTSPAGSHP